MKRRARTNFNGFTLVELLVVSGIIALLISILIPVLGRARDKANQTACLSNLRQIGTAFRMYAGDNKDWCPFSAPLSFPTDQVEDWIHWRTGINNAGVQSSAIAPYLGGKSLAVANIFRCPADRLEGRPSFKQYPFSYSMNIYFDPRGLYPQVGGKPVRLSTTRNASEKVLVAEENEVTINDGYWVPGSTPGMSTDPKQWECTWDWLSIRHDSYMKEIKNDVPVNGLGLTGLPNRDRRGDVVFADGHAELVPRDYAHDPRHALPRF
jgi:prepilin-type N-terminal cleavage/methylation domain-containing protein/prepilin-type processing-associated H-X9-DG protein